MPAPCSRFPIPSPTPSRRWTLAVVPPLVALVLLVACAPDRETGGPTPPTTPSTVPWSVPATSAAPRPTVPPPVRHPDTRGVALPELAVAAPPTTSAPLAIYGGRAELSGSLAYLGEPVSGATVRLERWVDGRSTSIELTTGPGGGWLAPGIQGGRYVIRAWKGNRLVLEQASAVFLAEDEERAVHLSMVEVYVPPADDEDETDDADEDEDDEDADADDADEDDADEDDDAAGGSTTTTGGAR